MEKLEQLINKEIHTYISHPELADAQDDLTRYIVVHSILNNCADSKHLNDLNSTLARKKAYHFIKHKVDIRQKHLLDVDNNRISKYRDAVMLELDNEPSLHEGRFIPIGASQYINKVTQNKEQKKRSVGSDNFVLNKTNLIIKQHNNLIKQAINEKCLMILGEAGSGKSTVLKYLFKSLIKNERQELLPIFVPLIRFKEHVNHNHVFEDALHSLISHSINKYLPVELKIDINRLNLSMGFAFFFDGLDEIIDLSSYNMATRQLKDLINQCSTQDSSSKILISCRTNDDYYNFKNTKIYKISSLTDNRIVSYLSSYFPTYSVEKVKREIFKKSIKPNSHILSMARSPFLLFLIANTIKNNPNNSIPDNKGALIENYVINAIPKIKRDESIDIPVIRTSIKQKFLGRIAHAMTESSAEEIDRLKKYRRQLTPSSKNFLTSYKEISKKIKMLSIKTRFECPSDVRDKIENAWRYESAVSPHDIVHCAEKERLLKAGSITGILAFNHPIIQDYFSACHLKNSLKSDKLGINNFITKIISNEQYFSVIPILIGIVDPEISDNIFNLLTEKDLLLASECFRCATFISAYSEENLIQNILYKINYGYIDEQETSSIGLNWDDISGKLIGNKLAKKVSTEKLYLAVKYEDMDQRFIDIFADDYIKIIEILQRSKSINNYIAGVKALALINSKKSSEALRSELNKNLKAFKDFFVYINSVLNRDHQPITYIPDSKFGLQIKSDHNMSDKAFRNFFAKKFRDKNSIKIHYRFINSIFKEEIKNLQIKIDHIISNIGGTSRKEFMPLLLELIEHPLYSLFFNHSTAKALVHIDPVVTSREIIKLIGNNQYTNLEALLLTLGETKTNESVDILIKFIKDDGLYSTIIDVLSEIDNDKAISTVIKCLRKPKKDIIYENFARFVDAKSYKYIPHLEKLYRYKTNNIFLKRCIMLFLCKKMGLDDISMLKYYLNTLEQKNYNWPLNKTGNLWLRIKNYL